MDIISRIVEEITKGEARKANGPIEHWLTTLATGFWGFDADKESVWSELKKGDVLVFQSIPPNSNFVSNHSSKTKTSGFIGAGIVERISKKTEPRWLSEVIESQNSNVSSPMMWPNLVHFSDVLWLGDVGQIPAQAVQAMIDQCSEEKLDLGAHIAHLASNRLSLNAMKDVGFTYAPMGTGGRLKKNADKLAELFKVQAQSATHVAYGVVDQPILSPPPNNGFDSSNSTYGGTRSPTKRKAKPPTTGEVKGTYSRKRDYLQEATDNQNLGLAGELLVFERERLRVHAEHGEQYVSQVVHVSLTEGDGAGYDIRSVRETGSGITPYYLEVKTTSGDANTAFFISENEVNFAAANPQSFELVRVHSLGNGKSKHYDYRLSGYELLGLPRTPVSYRVNVGIEPDQYE
ncbi:DUF3883 domain-containing protein [Pseudomonas taetrolens]|uniref:DUF3883 domain-containing protein n=1 Tax=Pseudomonas taetrolens TaxID=47884 RepID=UPI0030D6F35F